MNLAFDTIAAPTSAVAGAPTSTLQVSRKTVYLDAIVGGTYQVQLSGDPANPPAATSWANEGAALTASGSLEVTKPAAWVRVNVTAYASGTPVARLVAERAR